MLFSILHLSLADLEGALTKLANLREQAVTNNDTALIAEVNYFTKIYTTEKFTRCLPLRITKKDLTNN